MNTLHNLFTTIDNKLINNTKLNEMIDDIISYNGNDWYKYIQENDTKYNRNIVFKNNKLELIIITWKSTQGTLIHGHPENGCLFKILTGNLQETFYSKSGNDVITNYKINDVSYIHNNYGKHKVTNISKNTAISLHLYSPPLNLET